MPPTSFTPAFNRDRITQLQQLLNLSKLPSDTLSSESHAPFELGVDLDWLDDAKRRLEDYDVRALEERLSQ